MTKILEELWYGNVNPCDRTLNKQAKELIGYIARHEDELRKTLTDKQAEVLDKFNECFAELIGISESEVFTYAFRLGARIAIEVMSFEV